MRPSNYGEAEFLDEQLSLSDLVPTNLGVIVGLLTLGLLSLAGLLGLYLWSLPSGLDVVATVPSAFDLCQGGNLASWFSSTVLLAAAFVAVIVFSIRRFRTDDFQGYYRVWLWAAACWLLLSIDKTAGLHHFFQQWMIRVTGTRLLGDGTIWWAAAYLFLLGAVGIRLAIDMRRCFLSTTALLTTAICYGLAVAVHLGWLRQAVGVRTVLVEEGLEIVGHLLLLTAMTLHARHVLLDAHGFQVEHPDGWLRRIGRRLFRPSDHLLAEDIESELIDSRVAVHPPHGSRRRRTSRLSRSGRVSPVSPSALVEEVEEVVEDAVEDAVDDAVDDAVEIASSVPRRLSKSEKKALKRRLRQSQRDRRRD